MKKDIKNIREITCKEAEKSLNDLIDGYLKGQTKIELEHHLAHCRHCFGRVEFEQKLKEKIRTSASARNLNSLRKRIVALIDQE